MEEQRIRYEHDRKRLEDELERYKNQQNIFARQPGIDPRLTQPANVGHTITGQNTLPTSAMPYHAQPNTSSLAYTYGPQLQYINPPTSTPPTPHTQPHSGGSEIGELVDTFKSLMQQSSHSTPKNNYFKAPTMTLSRLELKAIKLRELNIISGNNGSPSKLPRLTYNQNKRSICCVTPCLN